MALVTIGAIYTNLDVSTIRGKSANADPLLYRQLQQQAMSRLRR